MANITEYGTFIAALDDVQKAGPVWNMIKELSNAVHSSSDTMAWLNKKAKSGFRGGDNFTWQVINAKRRGKSYYGATKLNTDLHTFLGQAIILRAYYTESITYLKTTMLQNQGKEAFQDYVARTIDQSRKSLAHGMALDTWGNGTTDADGGFAGGTTSVLRPIIGFQLPIDAAATPNNTYATLSQSTYEWWRNNAINAGTGMANVTLAKVRKMIHLCNRLDHGGSGIDLIVCPIPLYTQLCVEAQAKQALAPSAKKVDLMFPESFTIGGATVIPEKYITATTEGGVLTTGLTQMFFLNSSDIEWKVATDDDVAVGPVLRPTDEHSFVQHLTWSGQLVVKNPAYHGVIYWA